MSFALSFVPLKSTKMAQYKRFMEKPSFFTGQISTFAPDKTMFRKGLYGSEVLLDIFSLGFVPFLSRQTSTEKKQNMEVVDNKCVAKAKISKNAVTTSNHQNGPCEPVKVASHRNSFVWNITSSISSSRMLMPKSESMLESAIIVVFCYSSIMLPSPEFPLPPLLLLPQAELLHLLYAAVANSDL